MLRTRLGSRAVVASTAVGLLLSLGSNAPALASLKGQSGTAPVLLSDKVVSPLHLASGPGGQSIYVADPFAGAIERLVLTKHGVVTKTVASGLGFPAGVAVRDGSLYVVGSGDSGPEAQGPTYFARLTKQRTLKVLIDMLAVERRYNPDGQVPVGDAESNPYDVIAYNGGFIIADAAANALIRLNAKGQVSVLTALPLITTGPCAKADNNGDLLGCDPVPTGVALGPDGLLYVSGLGAEQIGQLWVIDPKTGTILDNLTADDPSAPPLTDVAVARDGTVYASSLFTDQVFRLQGCKLDAAKVKAPTGLLVLQGVLVVGSAPAAVFEGTGPPPSGAVYAVPQGAFSPVT